MVLHTVEVFVDSLNNAVFTLGSDLGDVLLDPIVNEEQATWLAEQKSWNSKLNIIGTKAYQRLLLCQKGRNSLFCPVLQHHRL
jgi:hypothetical protein